MDRNKYAEECRKVVAEGCVLLENDGVLPFSSNEKIAVFGREQFEYVKSGSGSGGLVNCEYVTDIGSSLKDRVCVDTTVEKYYRDFIAENPRDLGDGDMCVLNVQKQPDITDEFVKAAAERNDKALIVISRLFGEGKDMKAEKGHYLLTDEEEKTISLVTKYFGKTAIVINSGNIIDLSWVKKYNVGALMLVWQGGQEGGVAVAQVLAGETFPSGKFPMTIAEADAYSAFPFGDIRRNIHTEDIYVGYRYALTFKPEKIIYPFGYGLGYTDFKINVKGIKFTDKDAEISVEVVNEGNREGKETVQAYFSAPQGKLGKAKRELVAFKKTDVLKAGDSEVVTLKFPLTDMRAFDDKDACGFGRAFVMERGNYEIFVGNDSVNCDKVGEYVLCADKLVEKTSDALHPVQGFTRLTPSGTEKVVGYECVYPAEELTTVEYTGDKGLTLANVADGVCSIDEFIAQFTAEELSVLVKGEGWGSSKAAVAGSAAVIGGVTETLRNHGVPAVTLCDGPSGPRTLDGKVYTCIPSGTIIASTWNPECIEGVFRGFAEELKESGIDIILAPGVNIHRHPFCGRNFEYFSEDPLLAGTFAAAEIGCFADNGILATIKHFAVNSQEAGRDGEDEVLSERALREIYLKVFEIAVRAGKVSCVMTSYNRINGISACASVGLTDVILRREWGYDGYVMSDWWACADKFSDGSWSRRNIAEMVKAQNDTFMVCPDAVNNKDDVLLELEKGSLSLAELQRSAKHVLECVMKTQAFKRCK